MNFDCWPNLSFERDCAKARSPSTLRWATNMETLHFLLLLVLVSTATASEGVWYDGNKIVPDRPHQKAEAGFGAQLQLTKKESFFTNWASPQTPQLEIARTAEVGDRVYSVLFFFGAGKDKKGGSHVTFTGRVLDPEGKPIQEFEDVRAIQGHNSAGEYDLRLSDGHMMALFSAASKKGTYTFELIITDHIKKVNLLLSEKIDLK